MSEWVARPDVADVDADHVGYEALMIACVTQAIEDFLDGPGKLTMPTAKKHAKARAGARRKRYEDSKQYIFDDTRGSREYVFGFAFILLSLGIDPEAARKSILRETLCQDEQIGPRYLDSMYASPENSIYDEDA